VPEKLVPLSDAARRLNLSASTLRHQIRNGRFNAFKIGRDWVTTEVEVRRYSKSHKMPDDQAEKYRHRSRAEKAKV
jgi:hypothetical protein